MSYLAYHFTVEPPQPGSEILIAMISDSGFDSFDFSENGFVAFVKEENLTEINFEDLVFEDFSYTFKIEKIPISNWNAEWENNFSPVLVDDLLLIRAPFHEAAGNNTREIIIMPKMSFGTGHHQTTRLMCKEMFSIALHGKNVLDMGTGTGILAILAKMLGANAVLGIDIDDWSVENSIENCAVNNYPEIEIVKGDASLLKNDKSFDVILANINKNILKADIPFYASSLNAGGKLLLSGFFVTDTDEIKMVAEANDLKYLHIRNENEWAMMVFEKNNRG